MSAREDPADLGREVEPNRMHDGRVGHHGSQSLLREGARAHREIRRTLIFGCITRPAAVSRKVSRARISAKNAKFSQHFNGHFSNGNTAVRILYGQPKYLRETVS